VSLLALAPRVAYTTATFPFRLFHAAHHHRHGYGTAPYFLRPSSPTPAWLSYGGYGWRDGRPKLLRAAWLVLLRASADHCYRRHVARVPHPVHALQMLPPLCAPPIHFPPSCTCTYACRGAFNATQICCYGLHTAVQVTVATFTTHHTTDFSIDLQLHLLQRQLIVFDRRKYQKKKKTHLTQGINCLVCFINKQQIAPKRFVLDLATSTWVVSKFY
jgi:hypothetical protein